MSAPIFLSEHFTSKEATSSLKAQQLGIDNTQFSDAIWTTAVRTAVRMEKVRIILHNVNIHIDSWIRCLQLNRALGSKDTSQHLKGEAVDFIAPAFGTPVDICKAIIAAQPLIRFDQLILEHTWVHISFCSPTDIPRGQVLSLLQDGKYATGLTTITGKSL